MRTIRIGWAATIVALLLLTLAACGREAPPRTPGTPATGRLGPTTAKQPTADAVRSTPASQPSGDPRALGDPSAPITIIEYSDFQ